jgi:hypothetical protein
MSTVAPAQAPSSGAPRVETPAPADHRDGWRHRLRPGRLIALALVVEDIWATAPYPHNNSVGDTVVWTNQARTKHTATSDDEGKTFDTDEIAQGQSSKPVKFEREGEFRCRCKMHGETMSGTVVATSRSSEAGWTSRRDSRRPIGASTPRTRMVRAPNVRDRSEPRRRKRRPWPHNRPMKPRWQAKRDLRNGLREKSTPSSAGRSSPSCSPC